MKILMTMKIGSQSRVWTKPYPKPYLGYLPYVVNLEELYATSQDYIEFH